MNKLIDLRSDTVTHPTPAMRKAMAEAEVGDDVFREDPTINRLQEMAAEKMGMEAGLLVPSGTMGNLVAILSHCQRGDEAIMGHLGHTFLHEVGGLSALGGIHPYQLQNQPDGTLRLEDIQSAIRSEDVHHPISRLVIIENTQNACGGVPLTAGYSMQVADLAHKNNMWLHVDGARIFNAAVALGVDVKKLVEHADSVTFCLSKGLCAPVGSVLCGSKEFIRRATWLRKMLGGGMRQAGVLAAAGIIAITEMVKQLAEDHRRAGDLAKGLAGIPVLQMDHMLPPTNMIYANLTEKSRISAEFLFDRLLKDGIKIDVVNSKRIRLVTHWGLEDTGIDYTVGILAKALNE